MCIDKETHDNVQHTVYIYIYNYLLNIALYNVTILFADSDLYILHQPYALI